MKKLTALTVAMMMAGSSASALAGTRTTNDSATAPHDKTTVHFSGTVTRSTCAFMGKSLKVDMGTVDTADFNNMSSGGFIRNRDKNFNLTVHCPTAMSADEVKMTIASGNGQTDGKVLPNAHGTAKGVGLELFYDHTDTPLELGKQYSGSAFQQVFSNAGSNNLSMTARYARNGTEKVTAGRLVTDAVFEIQYN